MPKDAERKEVAVVVCSEYLPFDLHRTTCALLGQGVFYESAGFRADGCVRQGSARVQGKKKGFTGLEGDSKARVGRMTA